MISDSSTTSAAARRTDRAPEPRWPAVLGALAAAVLHFALPAPMRVGPPWTLLGIVAVLVLGAVVAHAHGHQLLNAIFGYAVLAVLTGTLVYGLGALIRTLPHHGEPAPLLLRSAAVLWTSNVLVFAIGYWRLDAGGPHVRERFDAYERGSFLFPQLALNAPGDPSMTLAAAEGWQPGFVDYLFLSFTTSTAFSPTDTPVLSRWAKGMMMVQAIISIITIALLAARAVNIL